jgi:predicted Zn-dependent peptidase
VHEVIELTVAELAALRDTPVEAAELQRAKDHLKGSIMLGLESTSSRMSHLARQELQFGRQFTLDQILGSIDAVTTDDVQRVSRELFRDGALVATIVGPAPSGPLTLDHLKA